MCKLHEMSYREDTRASAMVPDSQGVVRRYTTSCAEHAQIRTHRSASACIQYRGCLLNEINANPFVRLK